MPNAQAGLVSKAMTGRPVQALIDCSAFLHNVEWVTRHCSGAKVLVVIKADAYGHGLVEMARLVSAYDLAVATLEEAILLIESGITNRIWVLEGPFSAGCLHWSTKHPLCWVIHSEWQFELLTAHQSNSSIQLCLKLDTGMHRLGMEQEALQRVWSKLQADQRLELVTVMTHFASSDQPRDASVEAQISRFDAMLADNALTNYEQSLSNSGAILNYPQAHRDLVRPGIILYGAMPDSADLSGSEFLRPVMRFESKVISLRVVEVGDSVGYGARWVAKRKSLIAIVAGGYADGYPRHAVDGTPVLVKGVEVPLAGRVSMDMLSVDVTDIEGLVSVGDDVELWGENLSVDVVARHAGTIGYELLTGISARVPKIYINN